MTSAKLTSILSTRLFSISAALVIIFLFAGLWPFNFTQPNLMIITAQEGLRLSKPSSAYTVNPPEKLKDLNRFTVYIDMVTSSDGLSGFEKILSYADTQEHANFIVGQWRDGLVLHLRADGRGQNIHFGERGILNKDERVSCAITFNGSALHLYVNGADRKKERPGQFTFNNWDDSYPLVIGTDSAGGSKWQGTLYEIAVFDRALTPDDVRRAVRDRLNTTGDGKNQDSGPLVHYIFRPEYTYETVFSGEKARAVRDLGKGKPADLVVPEQFMPYRRAFLSWDRGWAAYKSNWQDVAVNILGFVPFGILMTLVICRVLPGGQRLAGSEATGWQDRNKTVLAVFFAVAAGFAVSLAIELLQAYLPSRDSSLRDLVANTTGTALGAVALAWLVHGRTDWFAG